MCWNRIKWILMYISNMEFWKNVMNFLFQLSSAVALLGVSTYFGFKRMPAEMALAIVAGALGFGFANLEKFSEIKGGGFSGKLREQIKAVVDKETEQEQEKIDISEPISPDHEKVIRALMHPQYTWRSVSGLIRDTGMDIHTIGKPVNWLRDHGFVEHSFGRPGSIYALTPKGRQYAAVRNLGRIENA